jgi:hypothetical protein
MPSTKSRSEGRTLKELETRIEAEAASKTQDICMRGANHINDFCAGKGITIDALCRALNGDGTRLQEEVKTNIINEMVKQAKEAKQI